MALGDILVLAQQPELPPGGRAAREEIAEKAGEHT
jgi:hypothetical protein